MYVVVQITPKNMLFKYCLQATIKKLMLNVWGGLSWGIPLQNYLRSTVRRDESVL